MSVEVEYVESLPGGCPAIWEEHCRPSGKHVTLYLRADMPTPVADRYRSMACRDAMPEVNFDAFTVTSTAAPVVAVA